MKIAVISTTINDGRGYLRWAEALTYADDEVKIFVALDEKVHHEIYSVPREAMNVWGVDLNLLEPEDQDMWSCSAPIGWRSIQRRNVALLEALAWGADRVITVDDDNVPVEPSTYLETLNQAYTPGRSVLLDSASGWWNPGQMVSPQVHHRGYPLPERHLELEHRREAPSLLFPKDPPIVGVVAGLWLGDPDIDATERISKLPLVHFTGYKPNSGGSPYTQVSLAPGTWSPFNTQSTAFSAEVAPLMQVLSGVGRYDDIWMSYVARRIMDSLGLVVSYGQPLVRQERNEHDLTVDVEKEMYGYRKTPALIEALLEINLTETTPVGMLRELYFGLEAYDDLLPRWTQLVNRAWLADLEKMGYT